VRNKLCESRVLIRMIIKLIIIGDLGPINTVSRGIVPEADRAGCCHNASAECCGNQQHTDIS
jgi:hypothetical protein